jgi:hypothetical protein
MSDEDYEALERAARERRKPISRLVRESLKRTLAEPSDRSADERLAAFLRFARFNGPTGDIEQILAEIDRGRGLT